MANELSEVASGHRAYRASSLIQTDCPLPDDVALYQGAAPRRRKQRNAFESMSPSPADDAQPRAAGIEPECTQVLYFEHVPSYQEFFDKCLVSNRPCILPSALVQDWSVVKHKWWQAAQHDGIDWEYLAQHYGEQVSPVVVCKTNGDEERQDMMIKEGVELIRAFNEGNSPDIRSVYIKDWHLIGQLRSNASEKTALEATETEPYTVPIIFADDWMNNIASGDSTSSTVSDDDFRFVYAGTTGSRTTLHRDVYTSYSWSTNVVGRKVWHLFPPSAIPHLRRFPAVETSQLVSDVETLRQIISAQHTPREYPHLRLAWDQVQTIIQEQGQTIFVPSNWYHQVENLDDCISINRNWCNSVNIPSLYNSIKQELAHVEESLSDVRDMLSENDNMVDGSWRVEFAALVQDLAVKDAGWAWLGFWNMVQHNLRIPAACSSARPSDGWVTDRILPLVVDFETDPGTPYLAPDIINAAKECRRLLDNAY